MNPHNAHLLCIAVLTLSLAACGGGGGDSGGPGAPGTLDLPPIAPERFVHVASGANIDGSVTYLDSPYTDNRPNAILLVAHLWNPPGQPTNYNDHAIAVWYNETLGKWAIVNQDFAAILPGTAFNVDVATGNPSAFVHTVSSGNRSGHTTWIDRADTNSDRNAVLMITQNMMSPGFPGSYPNNHPIGVYFDDGIGVWRIQNEDLATMPLQASFNVVVASADPDAFVHVATLGNITSNRTRIDHPDLNGRPDAKLLVTKNANPDGRVAFITDPENIGVYYDGGTGRWAIFNERVAETMPLGAAFNVRILR